VARTVKRAEIWTVSGGPDCVGKPRPALIVQDDHFDTDSVTVCPFTTDPTDAPLFRVEVEPSPENGLREACRLMVDKLTTIPRSKLGEQIGVLAPIDMIRLNRAIVVFLGLASPS
jgi:mRNA interferase MazF